MFPDKNLQKELALKLNLPQSTIKIWFRNQCFPDEDETSNSFHSLDQYLSPTSPSQKEKGSSLSIFADATLGLSFRQTSPSMTS
ncbi:arginine-fifty homeobox-like [Rhynchonycteris naso]